MTDKELNLTIAEFLEPKAKIPYADLCSTSPGGLWVVLLSPGCAVKVDWFPIGFEDAGIALILLLAVLKDDWRIEFCKPRPDGMYPILAHSPAGFDQSTRNEHWFVAPSIGRAIAEIFAEAKKLS